MGTLGEAPSKPLVRRVVADVGGGGSGDDMDASDNAVTLAGHVDQVLLDTLNLGAQDAPLDDAACFDVASEMLHELSNRFFRHLQGIVASRCGIPVPNTCIDFRKRRLRVTTTEQGTTTDVLGCPECTDLAKEIAQLADDKSHLEQQVARDGERRRKFRRKAHVHIRQLMTDAEALQRQKDALEAKKSELDCRIIEYEDRVAELEHQVVELRDKVETLEQEKEKGVSQGQDNNLGGQGTRTRARWTADEDKALIAGVARHGPDFVSVSKDSHVMRHIAHSHLSTTALRLRFNVLTYRIKDPAAIESLTKSILARVDRCWCDGTRMPYNFGVRLRRVCPHLYTDRVRQVDGTMQHRGPGVTRTLRRLPSKR